jgi:hypothetical protein
MTLLIPKGIAKQLLVEAIHAQQLSLVHHLFVAEEAMSLEVRVLAADLYSARTSSSTAHVGFPGSSVGKTVS